MAREIGQMKLRRRVALSMLSVMVIFGGVSTVIGGHLLWRNLRREAQDRVSQDLNAAQEFYEQRLAAMSAALLYTALGERFAEAVASGDVGYLASRLEAVRKNASLDVLYVTDAQGRVLDRTRGRGGGNGDGQADAPPLSASDSAAGDRLVKAVLEGAQALTGTILVPLGVLARENPVLAERARIPILPTPMAIPSGATELDSAMMLSAAAPVYGPQGKLVGVLRAGTLLNRNYGLVDQVQNTVFRNQQYRGKALGNATVFQGDVRISTNVLRADGTRAIGTRVSAEVNQRVLGEGRPWLGRAWVVNDWYVSAYAPIYDLDRRPIGMLYVGALQRKFTDVALGTMATFALVITAGLVVATLVAWKLADSIARPVRELAGASEAIARGEFATQLDTPPGRTDHSSDEIDALARTFNAMARSLRQRDEQLKQRTRMQLTRSERLASVGRLAAGVAHEINNPLTGVLTFSHMLLRDAPEGSQQREDVQTIIDATTRCRDIVRGLLNFSRQNEPQKRLASLNGVMREAVNLTRNQAQLHQIRVVEELDERVGELVIDPHQIQEVAVNAILNAIDAMPEGGTLTVRTRRLGEPRGRLAGGQDRDLGSPAWAEFEIADTGCGIPPENLEHIFDPFFTTKPPGKGTGLGLAISYGIITEHGGEISVSSEPRRGTTFIFRLPAAAEEHSNDQQATRPGD